MAKKKKANDVNELVSIAEAARLRHVTHAAIQDLIRRGRLPFQEIAGRRLLRRGDVLNFEPEKGGRGRKGGKR
jgi:hypothetical protein